MNQREYQNNMLQVLLFYGENSYDANFTFKKIENFCTNNLALDEDSVIELLKDMIEEKYIKDGFSFSQPYIRQNVQVTILSASPKITELGVEKTQELQRLLHPTQKEIFLQVLNDLNYGKPINATNYGFDLNNENERKNFGTILLNMQKKVLFQGLSLLEAGHSIKSILYTVKI